MIVRTGVDLVSVADVAEKLERSPQLREELFAPEELAYAQSRARPAEHLAARWAAKEALVKVFGLDALGYELCRLWIDHDPSGRPRFVIDSDRFLADAARVLGTDTFDVDVSLSHEATHAIAFVVVTCEGGNADMDTGGPRSAKPRG